ncbi:winged helix-turn-helix transcriptional regulator [Antribacter sp. KLBMP9083]|uniref:Winged helix-turn-helix transcriptional regulator n=1 Tax=Antribacter soli TaxID=2910976 RepID=A0AA41U7L7_9MICO|nr:helix-turn-helix domain-containing protein [Antribacter soli]MCF4121515.1 winged helix-turn-helix transcriptional regulator [Antribacter soli]
MSTTTTEPTTAHAPAYAETDGTTRRRVLQLVAVDGPVTAADLAHELGLTAPAVRRHLGLLEDEGKISVHENGTAGGPAAGPVRRGRPARHYVVTSGGQSELAGGYQEIAGQVLRYLRDEVGPEAVAGFARERYDAVVRRYEPRLTATDPAGRAVQLAALLSSDGYAASARPVPAPSTLAGVAPAVQLCQGHCPVQHVAEEFNELCEAEAQAFSRLLGSHVQRLATIARGAHACTTNIPLKPPTEGTR